jgi:methionine sulfoxide reductase heme-binding subunit
MNWFRANWGWVTVIILALLPLTRLISMINIDFSGAPGSWITMDSYTMPDRHQGRGSHEIPGFDIALKETGEWAIRWLVIVLSLTPYAILTGRKPSLWVRQAAGIAAFSYAGLHLLFFCIDKGFFKIFSDLGFVSGFSTTIILFVLAITSNTWSMKMLKNGWKKLHRYAYLAALLAILHVALLKHGDWIPYLILLAVGFLLRVGYIKSKFSGYRNRGKTLFIDG